MMPAKVKQLSHGCSHHHFIHTAVSLVLVLSHAAVVHADFCHLKGTKLGKLKLTSACRRCQQEHAVGGTMCQCGGGSRADL